MASPEFRTKAVSWVMLGGILAGFIGPTIALKGKDLIADAPFAGSYLFVIHVPRCDSCDTVHDSIASTQCRRANR